MTKQLTPHSLTSESTGTILDSRYDRDDVLRTNLSTFFQQSIHYHKCVYIFQHNSILHYISILHPYFYSTLSQICLHFSSIILFYTIFLFYTHISILHYHKFVYIFPAVSTLSQILCFTVMIPEGTKCHCMVTSKCSYFDKIFQSFFNHKVVYLFL